MKSKTPPFMTFDTFLQVGLVIGLHIGRDTNINQWTFFFLSISIGWIVTILIYIGYYFIKSYTDEIITEEPFEDVKVDQTYKLDRENPFITTTCKILDIKQEYVLYQMDSGIVSSRKIKDFRDLYTRVN